MTAQADRPIVRAASEDWVARLGVSAFTGGGPAWAAPVLGRRLDLRIIVNATFGVGLFRE
ncbi:MAG TPA: hypothetical protein VGX23_08775 [Actinocrinis sp.]|nr:hypothetical protein [Actinocrinis sp.]